MAKILLVDDEASVLDMLALAFEDAGHEVVLAKNGLEGLKRAQQDAPDLIVSDVNLPGLDGFTLCRRLRDAGDRVPMILLTARDSEIDQALGLELGADDYVVKPWSTRVLLARVGALLRREQARAEPVDVPRLVVVGDLVLDPERIEIRWRDTLIETTVTEFRLVEVLARRPGVVFDRDQLLTRIRGDDSVVAERLIDTYVRRLRRKFELVDPAFEAIDTLVGAGYRWKVR